MNPKKTIKTVLRACASLAAAAALTTGVAAAQEPIRIGSVLAITGPASFLGDPSLKTIQYYVNKWNKEGGIDGRKLELVYYDAAGAAAQARTFANRLLTSDKVHIIIGGSTTGTSMAISPLAERYETPLIALGSGVPIVEPVQEWVYKIPHTDRMVAQRVLSDMQKRGFKRFALISETAGFGQSGRAETQKVAKDLGLTIVADETYAPTDTDMTAQLTRIRSTNPDAIFVFGAGQGPAILTGNHRQLGMTAPLYQSHGVASTQFIELAGAAAEGVRVPSAPILVADQLPDSDPQKKLLLDFIEEYSAAFGQTPSAFAGNAYDSMLILRDALERAGSVDGKALRQAIEETSDLVATNGIFNMTPEDHNGLEFQSLKMLEIRDGEFVLLDD